MKTMNLEEVLRQMEQETRYYGFRGATKKDLELAGSGEYLGKSLDLWDRRECDYNEGAKSLDGTSAITITEWMDIEELRDAFNYAMGYAKNHHGTGVVLLVSGDNSEYGDDEREIILKDDFENGAKIIAQVVAV